jgi:hypothetical protein
MPNCVCVASMLGIASVGSYVLTAQTGDNRWVVFITAFGAVFVAFCTMVIAVAPHVSKAIVTLGATILPAFVMLRKQMEELNKGLLSTRIETLLDQNAKLTAQLQSMRDEFSAVMEYHKKQRQALIEQLESGNVQLNLLQRSLDEAREEITEYRKGQVVQSERMDVVTEAQSKINVRVEENAANIRKTVDHLMGGSSDQIPMVP